MPITKQLIKKAKQIREDAQKAHGGDLKSFMWSECVKMAMNGEEVKVAKVSKRAMKKFNEWKDASPMGRITINFTSKQSLELVNAGLCKAGLFGGIVDLDNTVDEETRNSLVELIKTQRIAMTIA